MPRSRVDHLSPSSEDTCSSAMAPTVPPPLQRRAFTKYDRGLCGSSERVPAEKRPGLRKVSGPARMDGSGVRPPRGTAGRTWLAGLGGRAGTLGAPTHPTTWAGLSHSPAGLWRDKVGRGGASGPRSGWGPAPGSAGAPLDCLPYCDFNTLRKQKQESGGGPG